MSAYLINAHIVGLKVANPDEEKRKELFESCHKGEILILRRESDNPHDPDAIAVLRESTEKLGYVSKDEAKQLARQMDQDGAEYEAVLASITGGKPGLLASIFGAKEKAFGFDIVINKKK
ncbi:hypothetical protein GF373_01750 [bacterium]|nr:hypothetical protein [bacterium]